MNSWFTIKDSRQKDSRTLFFVTISWFVVLVKFAIGGHWGFESMSGVDFGVAVAGILGIWVMREFTDKAADATVKAAVITATAKVEEVRVATGVAAEAAAVQADAAEVQADAAATQVKAASIQKDAAAMQDEKKSEA